MFTILLVCSLGAPTAQDDYDAQAALALAAAAVQHLSPAPVLVPAPAVVMPTGHTHTCANGHSWDHATNPTHTCQVCGLEQWVQDTTPRMATIGAGSNYSLGGCANGNCPTAGTTFTQQRGRLFRR